MILQCNKGLFFQSGKKWIMKKPANTEIILCFWETIKHTHIHVQELWGVYVARCWDKLLCTLEQIDFTNTQSVNFSYYHSNWFFSILLQNCAYSVDEVFITLFSTRMPNRTRPCWANSLLPPVTLAAKPSWANGAKPSNVCPMWITQFCFTLFKSNYSYCFLSRQGCFIGKRPMSKCKKFHEMNSGLGFNYIDHHQDCSSRPLKIWRWLCSHVVESSVHV